MRRWLSIFVSSRFQGPGPVSEKNEIVQKGKSGVHAISTKNRWYQFRRWNGIADNETGAPSHGPCEYFSDKRD